MAHVILANPTAGLLAGDRHEVRVHVGSGARARVTTQAATKVFSMASGHAQQVISLRVAEGGVLEFLPGAVIPFRHSGLVQRVEIEVVVGGTAVYGDGWAWVEWSRVSGWHSDRFRWISRSVEP